MFNYLNIEQAINYINKKVDYDFTLSNLKELKAFGYINTVFYYEGLAKFSVLNVDGYCSMSGYFKLFELDNLICKEPIYFETCFLALAANEYEDPHGDITVSLIHDENSKNLMAFDRTNKTMKVNPYEHNFRLTDIDEQGDVIERNIISPNDVRISKNEIDNWLNSTTPLNANEQLTDAQDRIAELEKQLSKFQAAAADVVTIPFGKRLDLIDKNLPQSERIEKSYELYGVGFYEDKHPVNTPDEMIKRIQGLLKVIRDKDSKISELEKQTNTPNNAQDKIDELENQLSQIKAELATAPADDKELPSNSQAGVARMLYAILTEHGYDLSPMKGKGVANDMIVSAANTHGTSVTRNFVADWLIRAREVKIKNT